MHKDDATNHAKAAWNSISDQFNDWDALSGDERETYTQFSAALSALVEEKPVKAETVEYRWDGIAGKMRYFGSAAPNGWLGDKQPASVTEQIADTVLSWMVKYDLLDAGNEYQAADVLAVLDDLVPACRSLNVEKLKWVEHQNSFPAPTWSAKTPFGFYNIEEVSGSDSPVYEVRLHAHHLVAVKDGLPEAKESAQSDYETRILSALVDVPAVDAYYCTDCESHIGSLNDGRCPCGSGRVVSAPAHSDVPAVESEPVAWTSQDQLDDAKNSGLGYLYASEWKPKKTDIPLYASPVRSAIAPAPAEVAKDDALFKAALAVEQWWLDRGIYHFDGAPYAIFALRRALSPSLVHAEDGIAHGSTSSTKGRAE